MGRHREYWMGTEDRVFVCGVDDGKFGVDGGGPADSFVAASGWAAKSWMGITLFVLVCAALVSMLGWVFVGLPVLLLLREKITANLHWLAAPATGAAMGLSAMLLFRVVLDPERIDTAYFRNAAMLVLFSLAALIGGVAFAVYCSLVKAALRRQAKENGAPSGTPRSLAWFEF